MQDENQLGRIVFGTSAVLLAIVALLWHDSDFRHARILAIAQIAGGILMLHPRTARLAAVVLGAVFTLFALASVPGIVAAPTTFEQYDNFFEQFCVVCGAIAVYAATDANPARTAVLERLARVGLGLCAISFALAQIVYFQFTASLVPSWIPPSQAFWTTLTTLAFVLAAVAMLVNVQARLAMRLTALMLAIFGLLVWVPHLVARPHSLDNWSEFAVTFLIAGAAWVVSARSA